MPRMMLETATPQSQVKHSIIEPAPPPPPPAQPELTF